MFTNHEAIDHGTNELAAVVDASPAEPALTPEEVVDLLRAASARMGDVAPMTAKQRKALRRRTIGSNPILQASINVIGAHEIVSLAVGQPAEEVRQLQDEANRWTAVEDELRAMLNGVIGANLLRRQRIALIATRAYNVGAQLARDPAHAILVPHVQEIKRLKKIQRRRKTAEVPDAPPQPPAAIPENPPT